MCISLHFEMPLASSQLNYSKITSLLLYDLIITDWFQYNSLQTIFLQNQMSAFLFYKKNDF